SVILAFYVSGGIVGGLIFNQIRFGAFYAGSLMLMSVLANDLILAHAGAGQMFQRRAGWLSRQVQAKKHVAATVQAVSANGRWHSEHREAALRSARTKSA